MLRNLLVLSIVTGLGALAPVGRTADVEAKSVKTYTEPKLQLTVVSAQLELPADRHWEVTGDQPLLCEVQLDPVVAGQARPPDYNRREASLTSRRFYAARAALYNIYYYVNQRAHELGHPPVATELDEHTRQLLTTDPLTRAGGGPDAERGFEPEGDDEPDAAVAREERAEREAEAKARAEERAKLAADTAADTAAYAEVLARLRKEGQALAAQVAAQQRQLDEAKAAGKNTADLERALQELRQEVERNRRQTEDAAKQAAKGKAARQAQAEAAKQAQDEADAARHARAAAKRQDAPPRPAHGAGGAFFFLVPGVTAGTPAAGQPAQPLALELRPALADGRHFVLDSAGVVRRVPVDAALLAKHGLKLAPLTPAAATTPVWELRARLAPGAKGRLSLPLTAPDTTARTTVVLDLDRATPGTPETFKRWVETRCHWWRYLADAAPDSALASWCRRAPELYGVQLPAPDAAGADWREEARQGASLFSVIGGRAAIQETLQLQALRDPGVAAEPETVTVNELPGVDVKAHPYEQLLGGKPGGRLPLADFVPPDRALIYFANPAALLASLDAGSGFLFKSFSAVAGNGLDHDLQQRYLGRLGLDTGWGRLLVENQAVAEMAIALPDLFFLDGTDVTVILRVPQLDKLAPLFKLAGVADLRQGGIVTKALPAGQSSFWAARDQLLVVSTNQGELMRVLRLVGSKGQGSLGQSAEFRYLLSCQPVTPQTLAYVYLSDPFIRRLVGPEVKLGQLRRLRARADLEALSAGALLYRADGHADRPDLKRLADLGYVPAALATPDYALDDKLVARSTRYGTAGNLASLLAAPVTTVTPAEAAAYKQYLDEYRNFWRQFFDPIAIRCDATGPTEFTVDVFILPLIDSSIYQGVRQVLVGADGLRLNVPELAPPPVLQFSVNLSEQTWAEATDGLQQMSRELGLDPRFIDQLSPVFHLAVLDADPVISLGSGDLLGALGAAPTAGGMAMGQEMFLLPVALTLFTRPAKLMVELHDPDVVKAMLAQATSRAPLYGRRRVFFGDVRFSLARVSGRDEYLGTVDLMGLLKLRYGVSVQQNYLVLSNIPWSTAVQATRSQAGLLNSVAVQVNPGAGRQQLPGLFAAACERQRQAAHESAGHLYPLLVAGAATPAAAAVWHRQLFGFTPVHPGAGEFAWRGGRVVSSRFGSVAAEEQPAYAAGDRDFGGLRQLERLTLSMELADDGLRSRLRWSLAPAVPAAPAAPAGPAAK